MNRKICQSVALSLLVGALSTAMAQTQPMNSTNKTETATFGGGCYWCTEAIFQMLPGVKSVTSGFAGGTKENPSYEEVCTGNTGHAEVIHIEYDPAVVSYEKLLAIFWQAHDPTTLDRQGADVGTQYRSIILYNDEAQKVAAERSKVLAQKDFKQRIVTEIVPLKKFYAAKLDHQNYYRTHPNQGYCRAVIRPKVEKFEKKLKESKESKEAEAAH
jgi:peptide-methionine (S)-S-oxide reductase